jgi:hypothetical protein
MFCVAVDWGKSVARTKGAKKKFRHFDRKNLAQAEISIENATNRSESEEIEMEILVGFRAAGQLLFLFCSNFYLSFLFFF